MTPSPTTPPVRELNLPTIARKIAIWGLFLLLFYTIRDFFFMAFATFLISYLVITFTNILMKKLSPNVERSALRKLITLGIFLVVPAVLLVIGILIAPRLLDQGKKLSSWLSQLNPETEAARLCERYVGPSEFKRVYPNTESPEFQKDLEAFRKSGLSHMKAYNDFPQLETWVEGGFHKQFMEAQSGQVRSRLMKEGTSSADFTNWFLKEKAAQLRELPADPLSPLQPLAKIADRVRPDQLLERAKNDPAMMEQLRQEWIKQTEDKQAASVRATPAYQAALKEYYEQERAKKPAIYVYTFNEYIELQKIRPEGRQAFGDMVEKFHPVPKADAEKQLRSDFEAYREHELFQTWWGTSSPAKFIRHHLEGDTSGKGSEKFEKMLTSLLNIPLDLFTAVLLSLFICIDFPKLKRGLQGLKDTWLRDVYDELAPAFSNLGQLVGRAMFAQGIIAFCNAVMILIALTFLGVEHEFLLAGIVFVLCMIPTLGAMIAWAIIVLFTLLQPDGGVSLALQASGAFLFVMCMEMFVLSPRILGKMMEIHPVMSMTILPIGQYFFGIWGLILAVPVAVYIVYIVIFRCGLPGVEKKVEAEFKPENPTADDLKNAVKKTDVI